MLISSNEGSVFSLSVWDGVSFSKISRNGSIIIPKINIKKTRTNFLIISFFAKISELSKRQGHLGKFKKGDTMLVKKAMGILEHLHRTENEEKPCCMGMPVAKYILH